MLEAKNIYKSYKGLQVLKGTSLSMGSSEIVSITGKSGSGKSTFLNILGTLDKADSGSVKIANQEINSLSEKLMAKFRNETIGFVFQFHHLLPEFTALENVCIPAYIQKSDKKTVVSRAKELLDYLGLSERLDHKPGQLSGGEQQRVAVARALINKPKIIFADEPSGNLDNDSSDELHKLIFKLREDFQQSFVIVTHNLDLAKMSDRNYHLVNGILDNGEPTFEKES
jgi:lipoprotein-releasing system ATP-binding protein